MNEPRASRRRLDHAWTPLLEIVDGESRTVVEISGDERGGGVSLRSTAGQELVTLKLAAKLDKRFPLHGEWALARSLDGDDCDRSRRIELVDMGVDLFR